MQGFYKVDLVKMFKNVDVELSEDIKQNLVGSEIKDEDGKVSGKIVTVDMEENVAYVAISDYEAAEKFLNNYGVE